MYVCNVCMYGMKCMYVWYVGMYVCVSMYVRYVYVYSRECETYVCTHILAINQFQYCQRKESIHTYIHTYIPGSVGNLMSESHEASTRSVKDKPRSVSDIFELQHDSLAVALFTIHTVIHITNTHITNIRTYSTYIHT